MKPNYKIEHFGYDKDWEKCSIENLPQRNTIEIIYDHEITSRYTVAIARLIYKPRYDAYFYNDEPKQ